MRQDRKLNGWVMLASILEIIFAITLLVAGGFMAGFGYFKPNKLLQMSNLDFFINQKGFLEAQLNIFDGYLKTEFLLLFLGIMIAVIALITLIFAIVTLNYAKKRKVVRHRIAVLIFTLIPLAVAGCVGFYLFKDFKALTDVEFISKDLKTFNNIVKYVCYAIIGICGLIALFNILGVMFGRSDKFMSNDNNKYAFDNSSLRNARANVNNNVKDAQIQPNTEYQTQSQANNPQQRIISQQIQDPQAQIRAQQGQAVRPVQPRPVQPGQAVRPVQPMRPQPRPMQPGQAVRPVQPRPTQPMRPITNAQGSSRPVTSRTNGAMPTRPMQRTSQLPPKPSNPQVRPLNTMGQVKKYCSKCGKLLSAGEKFCNLCGTKAAE